MVEISRVIDEIYDENRKGIDSQNFFAGKEISYQNIVRVVEKFFRSRERDSPSKER